MSGETGVPCTDTTESSDGFSLGISAGTCQLQVNCANGETETIPLTVVQDSNLCSHLDSPDGAVSANFDVCDGDAGVDQ